MIPKKNSDIKMGIGNIYGKNVVLKGDIKIGNKNVIHPGVVLIGPLSIGDNNIIFPNTVIGTPAENWDSNQFELENGRIEIGNNNIIRELVTIQKPLSKKYGVTKIHDDCFIMAHSHIPHDAVLYEHVAMSPGTIIGGHTKIMKFATLGINTITHQYTTIGSFTMIGMGSVVTKDVPPYYKAFGNPATLHGLNSVGMKRYGVIKQDRNEIIEFNRLRNKSRDIMKA